MSFAILGSTALAIAVTTAGAGAIAGGTIGAISSGKAKRLEEAKQRKYQKRLEALENSRQPVLDQADQIRSLKGQVFNPYANLAVANKAAQLKIEQTDEALANTLDQINRSGTGSGAATALARMAATSKAQVGASLEKQEVNNQQLRVQGEATAQAQKMAFEQKALQAEQATWGMQEQRDLATLDRLSGLQENAQAQAAAYQQQQGQVISSSIEGLTGLGLSALTASAPG